MSDDLVKRLRSVLGYKDLGICPEAADRIEELEAVVKEAMIQGLSDLGSDYVVVTAISSHRMRYVMHKDDLRALNPGSNPSDDELIEWAQDTVTMMECEEFSQMHIGESIIDANTLTEDEMLELFDRDNDYLSKWDRDQKIKWVSNTFKQEGQDNE